MFTARPIAWATAVVVSIACTLTAPAVAVTLRFGSIWAVLLVTTQLTLTAAATPTPPPLSPLWLEASLLAVLVESPAAGIWVSPAPLPPRLPSLELLVFGLPATSLL